MRGRRNPRKTTRLQPDTSLPWVCVPDTGDGVIGQLRDYPAVSTLLWRSPESRTWICGRDAQPPNLAAHRLRFLALPFFLFVSGYRDLIMAKCTSDRWVTHITDPACLAFPCLCATIRRACPTTHGRPASTAGPPNFAPSRVIGPAGNGMR